MQHIIKIFMFFFFSQAMVISSLMAQEDINKEVEVVKPYEPTISDAFKINLLPEIESPQRIDPEFNYSITPKMMVTDFEVRPISPAKMVPTALSQYYKSYLKLGFGNYSTPLAELSVNSLRSKKATYGLNIRHQSSNGKLELDNEKKVFAGYGRSSIDVFGKRIYRKALLSGNMFVNTNRIYYYGYNPEIPDTSLDKDEIKQNFLTLGAGVELQSAHKDSGHLNYEMGLNYRYFQDLGSNKENGVHFQLDMNKLTRNKKLWGATAEAHIFVPTGNLDTITQSYFNLNPYFSRTTSEYKFHLGINAFADISPDENSFRLYPQARLEFNIIPKIMIPYLGIDGYLQPNNYLHLINENHFVIPGTVGETSNHKLNFHVGLKGNFSSDISYNIGGRFQKINDLPLFINDTISGLGNQFMVIYDNMEVQEVSAEVGYLLSEKLQFMVEASYREYTMKNEQHPWHKPALNYSLRAFYNLSDKILVNFDILGEGKRFAKVRDEGSFQNVQLDGITNVNLGVEYRYSKILSGFIKTKNILGSRYFEWNYYPSQRFFIMAGFTYSL